MKSSLSLLLLTSALSNFALATEIKSGGETSTTKEGANAFSMLTANLPMAKRLDFSVGNSFFRNPWVPAPASTDARDGLGPLLIPMAAKIATLKTDEAIHQSLMTPKRFPCWCV